MTYVASFTCPDCGRTASVTHYSDTQAPVTPCVCGWRLPHEEVLRRIEAANREAAAFVARRKR